MLRTYKGRYEYGKLVFPEHEQVSMPDTANIIITILEDDINLNKREAGNESLTSAQRTAAQNFLKAMQELRKENFTEEDENAINDLQSGKYKLIFEERL